MRGTYDLISEKIDLHGTLKSEAEVSKATHGIKALMLKVLDPSRPSWSKCSDGTIRALRCCDGDTEDPHRAALPSQHSTT